MNLYHQIAEKTTAADAILVGASNGLSIAEGYNIFADDARFQRHFSDFRKKYGFRSLIQGSFSHFSSESEMWSYYSRMAYYYSYGAPPSPMLDTLYSLIKDKPYFVVTSNTDEHFERAGFEPGSIFELEGSMCEMQCAEGCHDGVYSNRETVLTMLEQEREMEVPTHYLPKCPVCGGPMQLHVPVNQNFIYGSKWENQRQNYQHFVQRFHNKKLLILEFGVGSRNQMIKAPFMQIVDQEPDAFYITFNRGELYIPQKIQKKALGVDGDLKEQLAAIQAVME